MRSRIASEVIEATPPDVKRMVREYGDRQVVKACLTKIIDCLRLRVANLNKGG